MSHARVRACRAVFPSAVIVALLISFAGSPAALAQASSPPPHDSMAEPGAPAIPNEDTSTSSTDVVSPRHAQQDASVTPHVQISGNIWRMNPGLVFLRTPIGLVTLSCKTCLRNLRGTPTVTLYVHGAHGAVEITPRGAAVPSHRYLWGPMTYAAPDKKELILWTPGGEQRFSTDPIASKLASIPNGRSATVEVSEAGQLMGLHDLQFDLQVSQLPSHPGNTEMKITGSVSKIKNGYVHVQTSFGALPITSKTGLCQGKDRCRAKVGQDLTLWIHDTNVAIDLHQSGSGTPVTRLLTGKLAYEGPDRKTLSLWTPDGEQSFPTDQSQAVLSSLKEGAPVIVELNAEGAVSDIRKGH